jgi:hypothetical protein
VTVDDGTDFAVGQTIVIGTEQLLITSISSNNLTAARGLNGTAGASHSDNTQVSILRWPAPVERATLINTARIWSRASAFEPFYVDVDLDTDVRQMLEPYRLAVA